MRRVLGVLTLAALSVAAAAGADISGRWSGTFKMTAADGQTRDGTALLVLKQSGSEITGSIGPNDGEQHAITKGKIEGDKITIESEEGAMVMKLDLVLTGDRIAGDISATGEGRSLKAKIDVAREKA